MKSRFVIVINGTICGENATFLPPTPLKRLTNLCLVYFCSHCKTFERLYVTLSYEEIISYRLSRTPIVLENVFGVMFFVFRKSTYTYNQQPDQTVIVTLTKFTIIHGELAISGS